MFTRAITFALLLSRLGCTSAQESAVILKQTAPISIASYQVSYEPDRSGRSGLEQIRHSVKLLNSNQKEIVAVRVGLVSFDSFGGLLARSNGYTAQTFRFNESSQLQWFHRPYGVQAFQGHGTGIAFVDAVRFSDRTIWRADINQVVSEIKALQRDIRAEDLAEKPEPRN